ncbi:MAG TPA: adenylate kinase [Candidatus Omnitrophota bacterium]|nr:adenylate kinase [Candidatus Omnitrophota bacterium]HPN88789.1 adenylate kinase [Candidatus Omnitrophota bacterium]
MRIVLLGPPGAGKGTLATAIKDNLGLLHISTGDILREEMKNNTPLGQEAKRYVESGGLVPDELVTRLIKNKLENDPKAKKGFLMDGFPRTLKQAQDLDKILVDLKMPVEWTLCLEASLDVILQRLTGRRVCKSCGAVYHVKNMPSKKEGICDKCGGVLYQRTDDNEATITNRMKVYTESTKPIIEYYKTQGKLKVLNADKEAQEVKELALKNLNG